MSTKFSSRFNANYNRGKRLQESVVNIVNNTKRFCWTQTKMIAAMNALRESDDYVRLPQYWRSNIESFYDGYRKGTLRDCQTHVHVCNDGKWRLKGDYTYKPGLQKSPMTVVDVYVGISRSKLVTHTTARSTCCIVWVDKPDHVFFMSEDTKELLQNCRIKTTDNGSTLVLDTFCN